jgi:ATP-dependent RNA helicase DeaD
MQSTDSSVEFTQLGLADPVLKAIQTIGYEVPTPIQAQCIPHLLTGQDLLGQAQTGTGKTAAFALPLLSRINIAQSGGPQVLVLTPTRELALQVSEAFQGYARHMPGFHVLPIYGGQSYSLQIRQLQRGVHVVVGTPGRVMDHLRRGTLNLANIRALVLDEADEMLNMGFIEDIEWIFEQAPKPRQVALFSATLPDTIRRVAQRHLTNPVEVRVSTRSETVSTTVQQHCMVTRSHKLDMLTRILELETFDAMLIFVRTKNATEELAEKLVAHGFAAEALNGDMSQALRERAIDRLKNGRLDLLVATDVAARGLDVDRITHVVNYDIPNDPESYVHRIGRTGRAGRTGKAILLVEPRERYLLQTIERTIHQRIPPLPPPSADRLSEHRIDNFISLVRDTLAEKDLDFFHQLVTRIGQEQELSIIDIAAALTYLVQRERPLEVIETIPPPPRMPRTEGPNRSNSRSRNERPFQSERQNRGEQERRERPQYQARSGERPYRDNRASRDANAETSETTQEGRRPDATIMAPYRIEVGRQDGVSPREIVGAIANEAGLEGKYIGRINIRDDHSTLDLPKEMPAEIRQHLRHVIVCGKRLELKQVADDSNQQDYNATKKPRRKRQEPSVSE